MTSTEIATRPAEQRAPDGAAHSALVLWAYEAQQAHQIAISLSKTSFVPATLRGKPHDITAAILAGQELGLQPMASLRSMDVIQGTPALRAHAMRGLVQSRGHKVWLVEQTPQRVVMRGQRKGPDGYEEVQESEWTIDRAKELGLTGKSEWKRQPQTMLTARATGEICRLVASDVLYAMPYAAEELDGHDPSPEVRERRGRVTSAEILGQPEQRSTATEGNGSGTGEAEAAPEPAPEPAPEQPELDQPDPNAWEGMDVAQPPDGER